LRFDEWLARRAVQDRGRVERMRLRIARGWRVLRARFERFFKNVR
jgi:hypothetical protein